ncbi:MAG TPA: transketolase [Planctomycetes bacterium]|nr:transketolase [Planctomycetota bacterium]
MQTLTRPTFETLSPHFSKWDKTADLIDQCIDLMLNLRQSGHPGGSRSKVPMMVASTLGAGMRWDVRRPELAFGDRHVLVAGHCCPLIYAMLAVYNEALRIRFERTGNERFLVPNADERQLVWEDLLWLRHNGHLSGHAEMEGKTLFFKFNTGPSGHGMPAAVGEALALKHSGAKGVRVFAVEGEGGHSAGVHHESKNTAFGLGLDNLVVLFDWNDHGIDAFPNSSVVHGDPRSWYEPYGWRVAGAEDGADYASITRALLEVVHDEDPAGRPGMVWFKTRKGRGYYKYDAASHGAPHKRNSELFWKGRDDFAAKYGVSFEGRGDTSDPGEDACREQTRGWFETVFSVLRDDEELVNYLSDTLIELGESVPDTIDGFALSSGENLAEDRAWLETERLPETLFVKPGEKAPNRKGLATFGAWLNAESHRRMGRPLVLAASADLADSTNISGFANASGDFEGFGWYERNSNPAGCLLPQQITEFANAGLAVGAATVNLSEKPEDEFLGYWTATSTYGSFSYLKYGMMRLFSQLAQDSPLKVGKTIWIVGHSGPETAEDSRTHFGIFAPAVTQLFPDGQVINLYPWEHNEVAPALAAALATEVPIVALHLTRPGIEIPDRKALGVPSHLEAARGAYVVKDFDSAREREGVLIVQGTSSTNSIYKLLPRFLAGEGPNVKIVQAVSPELFARQDEAYRESVLSREDWLDSTVITNGSRRGMHDWIAHRWAAEYAMSADRDNRWRTGGSVSEIEREAGIDADSLWDGIARFAADRGKRLAALCGER